MIKINSKLIPMGLAAVILSAALSAESEVKRRGTFIPRECGDNVTAQSKESGVLDIAHVCLGELAYMNIDAVELRLNDDSTLVYQIEFAREAMRGSSVITTFKGPQNLDLSANTSIEDDFIHGELSAPETTQGLKRSLEVRINHEALKAKVDIGVVFTTMGLNPPLRD